MKKKLNLTYAGNIGVHGYGLFLGDESISSITSEAMLEDGEDGDFLGRVTLIIEPIEDTGLNVEVE